MPQDNSEIAKKLTDDNISIRSVIDLLNEGHTVTIPLYGFSMRPFLENGRDKGLLAKMQNPQKGDIALAEVSPDFFVLHRIIKIKGDEVTLRGDGNLNSEHCKLSDLKAYAIGFYRNGSDKLEKTNSKKFKIYSWIWTTLFPIRRYLLHFYCILYNRKNKPSDI